MDLQDEIARSIADYIELSGVLVAGVAARQTSESGK
jgi:hypothetical protein